jgi:L-asparaginase
MPEDESMSQPSARVVKVIGTGGTITNTSSGREHAAEILKSIPYLSEIARLEIEDLALLGSSAITGEHWLLLSRRINDLLLSEMVDGIVVSHGSNTLEETAYFLNLTVKSPRPVIVTGAQRPFGSLSSDAAKNFVQAIRVAACGEASGKGVLVVTNDMINAARDVTKTISFRLETYRSRDVGALGFVDDDQITFYRNLVKKHTVATPFDTLKIVGLPRVDIIYCHVDADGAVADAAVTHAGAKGLVIAGFPTGSPTPEMHEVLKTIAQRGIPVVMTNRGGRGRVRPNTMIPKNSGVYIWGDNLTPQKARILLSLGLTLTNDREQLQRYFEEF